MNNVQEKCKRLLRKLLFLSLYFLRHHRNTVIKLASYGLSEIRVFKVRKWRGYDKTHSIRYFYTAKVNNEKCFVKVSNDSTINNEIFVYDYITRCGMDFVPRLLMSDTDYDNVSSLLVTEFRPNLETFRLPDDEKGFESLCTEFLHMHNRFLEFGIIHGDISPSNLLLSSKNEIFLIDFGIGRVPGSDVFQIDRETHYGTYFKENGNCRIYDDAYSFLRMLDDFGISPEYKQKDCYKRIESVVGLHTYKVSK